jgi:alpha-2-macroglobulin
MKKRITHLRYAIPSVIVLVVTFVLIVRPGNPLQFLKPDPGFRDWISAFSSGVLSTRSAIRVRLADPFADSLMVGREADPALFHFSPAVDGAVYWVDSRTLEFRPSKPMAAGISYTCTFHLGKLKRVPEKFKEFKFSFHTIRQDYEVRLDPPVLEEGNENIYRVTGHLLVADHAKAGDVHGLLEAVHSHQGVGKPMAIRWIDHEDGTRFRFAIDSLVRQKETSSLLVKHNGKGLGLKKRGEELLLIPGEGEFMVLDVTVQHDPDPCVVVTFSDLLQPDTDYDGLVRLGNMRNLRFSVDANRLLVYPSRNVSGEVTLTIERSVVNIHGISLGTMYSRSVDFQGLKPAVRMVGEGTILPSANGLLFPFEAVNLNAVDVQIQKIFERNVPQFLQVNELSGTGEMYRVATTVFHDKVDLSQVSNSVPDYGQWNRYALDLSTLISPERGAIYRVVLSFKREYSTWPCGDLPEDKADLVFMEAAHSVSGGDELWSFMGDHEDEWYGYEDFDWSERHNPCNRSYYFWKSVSRNILSSDLGLIAKAGSDGDLLCFVTDIITARPLAGIEVEVMDFQMQLLAEAMTDDEGKITFSLKQKPFLLIAKRDDERGYLKLSSSNTLSVSLFDVDGQSVRRGIKGFFYAERGVWRPGDTMFIHFILEDKQQRLPEDVPLLFELSDPQGNVVQRRVVSHSVRGIYSFPSITDEGALTGNYLGKVFLGNQTFARYYKVEAIKPNRLKVELTFPGDRITADEGMPGKLSARWLHGALSPGLKADVSMTLTSGKTVFKGFEGFHFDDPTASFSAETSVVFDGRLDDRGIAEVTPEIELSSPPGVLYATFSTKVFEPGGDYSINTTTVPYDHYSSYVGLWTPKGEGWWDMLESGRQHNFRVANLTSTGIPMSGRKLKVSVYKIDWSWWWHNSARGLPYFLSNTSSTPVFTSDVSVVGGRGQFNWGVASSEWGRYLIRVEDPVSGHATGRVVYLDSRGWGRRPGQMRDGASMLTISTNKGSYQVGEKAKVTIPSSPGGRALVSLESGTGVLRTEWIGTDSGTTHFEVPVTAEMAPNIYVHVMLIQPHSQTANDMPIRMYGVVPLMVEDKNTRLSPVITMPDVWQAEQRVSITVRETQGRPMAYTLAVVDEGLLDLTGFKTPDPWGHFYGREALGVRTWDLYSEVIGAFTAGFERLISIGGGDTRIDHDKQKERRFPPMVKSLGPFYLEAGKRATHTIDLPQYIGSVRVMVVAAHEGAYGHAEKTAAIRSPLMVLGTLPRVAGPGEVIDLPVNVFAMEKGVRNVQVSVTTTGLFETNGSASQQVTFSSPGDQVVNFRLRVKEGIGRGSVTISAASGQHKARQTVHLEVRNPVLPQTQLITQTIPSGESWVVRLPKQGIEGTNRAVVELSSMPPLNLSERLDYLIRYPHGCLEQILSAAFPQVLLREVIYLDKRSTAEVDQHIGAALSGLNRYLTSGGTFAYWPNGRYSNEWADIYAGHFMLEASRKGFALPHGLRDRWLGTQRRLASQWRPTTRAYRSDLIQAYRLYTLALAGAPDLGAMNRLRGANNLSLQARWRLAAAYAMAGRMRTARGLVEGAAMQVVDYNEYANTFGNGIRDKAMILETCLLLGLEDQADALALELTAAMNAERWYSTQTTAYCLIALGRYHARHNIDEGLDAIYTILGKAIPVKTNKSVYSSELPDEVAAGGEVVVKNNSSGTLFASVRVTGTPLPGEEKPASSKITLQVEYLMPDGTPIDPGRISHGTDFMARVTVRNTTMNPVAEIALSQIFPSGWQIHNARLSGAADSRTGEDSRFNHQDIRDDRILTYFNLAHRESVTFTVMLNATYTGRFYLPAVQVEAMYDATTFARGAGRWVEVVR